MLTHSFVLLTNLAHQLTFHAHSLCLSISNVTILQIHQCRVYSLIQCVLSITIKSDIALIFITTTLTHCEASEI